MKKKFIEKSYQFITKYQFCNDIKTKKIKYGLEAIYNLISKTIILFILSILIGIWKEYCLLIIFYSLVRMYTFGIHAKTTLACWLTSTPIYIGGGLFIKYAIIPHKIMYLIWLFAFLSFLLLAPADTPAKPLIHKKRRIEQKMKACLICTLLLIPITFFSSRTINNTICYVLFIQSICINPITYWLTKTPFANYKLYLKNHGLN